MLDLAVTQDSIPWWTAMTALVTQESIPLWTAVTAFATVCAATVSLIVAAISAWYAYLTRQLYLVQAAPKVVLYVKHDNDRSSLLMLIVENIGHDIAYDVKFTPSREIPKTAWGIDEESAEAAEPMTDGPLIRGIPALGPGDFRKINWGQYGGLSKVIGDQPIEVKIEYRFGKKIMTSFASLEMASFVGNDASESMMSKIANNLSKIATTIGKLPPSR